MVDGEKLLTHLNSALKVLLGLDIFPRVPKKKLDFVDQCYWQLESTFILITEASSNENIIEVNARKCRNISVTAVRGMHDV